MSESPIFIGGLDRSGKTLLRLALSAHPNIALTRRTHMWTDFYNRYGDLTDLANFERCLQAMLDKKAISVLLPDEDRIRREFLQGERSYPRLFELFHQHFAEKHGRRRWGEQEALIERYADPIFQAYPAARIIHMIRDPRTQYGETLQSTNVRVRLGKVGSKCGLWQYSAELAHRNRSHHSGRYMVLTFEYLMTDPERALRDVCKFIEEDYFPAMITFDGTIRFSAGKDADPLPSQGWPDSRIKQGFSSPGILTIREIRFIETVVRREMAENGYDETHVRFSVFDQFLYYFELPFNLVRFGGITKFRV